MSKTFDHCNWGLQLLILWRIQILCKFIVSHLDLLALLCSSLTIYLSSLILIRCIFCDCCCLVMCWNLRHHFVINCLNAFSTLMLHEVLILLVRFWFCTRRFLYTILESTCYYGDCFLRLWLSLLYQIRTRVRGGLKPVWLDFFYKILKGKFRFIYISYLLCAVKQNTLIALLSRFVRCGKIIDWLACSMII